MMRVLRIVGFILIAMGTIWFFQGIGVLPGSFMSGQPRWAVNGAIAVLIGMALVFASRQRPRR